MRTALQLSDDTLDERERQFLKVVREHGWFSTQVFDDEGEEPDFSYSTGFAVNLDFPEIIVFSLPKEVAHSVLWDLWRDVEAGRKPQIGEKIAGVFGNTDAVLLPVEKSAYAEHLGWSRWFYRGDDFECLQLIWPDREGRFPWEKGFDEDLARKQPDLTGGGWRSHPA